MGDTSSPVLLEGQKAAVVVIDNEFGVDMGPAIIPSEPLNDIWEQITLGLLKVNYDEVFVIKGHHPELTDNPIVEAVSSASRRFGTVDMFTMMHTNMIGVDEKKMDDVLPGLAQLPIDLFLDSLSPEQRTHLSHLYSMGCGDGNFMAAYVAAELGFKLYSGHIDSTINTIATFAFLKRVFEGGSLETAALETNLEMEKCLPQIGKVIDKHAGIVRDSITDYLDCQRNDGAIGKFVASVFPDLLSAFDKIKATSCIVSSVPSLLPAFNEARETALQCIPSLKEEWSYIKNPALSLFNLLPDELFSVDYGNDLILDELPKNWEQSAIEMAAKMHLVTYGEKSVPMEQLSREKMISGISELVRDKENIFDAGKMYLAVAILAKLGAKEALREMATVDYPDDDPLRIKELALKKLADLKDVAFIREFLMKRANSLNRGEVLGYLFSLGDEKYLAEILHSETTPPTLRRDLAEIFIDEKNFEAIKGLGHFFAEHNDRDIGIAKMWERAKNDPIFTEEYSNEMSSPLSFYNTWNLSPELFFEIADRAPELLIKAAQRTAARLATNSDERNRHGPDVDRIVFTVALLFDKGKITEAAAKALFARSKISFEEACHIFNDTEQFDGFCPGAVMKRLFSAELKK